MLQLAPSHVTKILLVSAIWVSNLHSLRREPAEEEGGPTILSGVDEEESYHNL